jgi:hypothetical protein
VLKKKIFEQRRVRAAAHQGQAQGAQLLLLKRILLLFDKKKYYEKKSRCPTGCAAS